MTDWITNSETGEWETRITESERKAWIEHCRELDEWEWCDNRKNEISENNFENF